MKYDITGRHLEVTPALRAHVETQLEKAEGAFEGKPATAHVVIEVPVETRKLLTTVSPT